MDTFEKVFYTVIFIVPGFVMAQIIDLICIKVKTDYGYHLIRCLYLSLIADIFGYLVFMLWKGFKGKIEPFLYWVSLFMVLMLLSSILAIILGCIKRSQFWRNLLAKIGIYVDHSIPYAWDYAFTRKDYFYLRIKLIDGTQVCGLYAARSFSSSEPDDRDILLEQVYDITEDNEMMVLKVRPKIKGIMIRGNQISSIDYLDKEKVKIDENPDKENRED